MARLLKHETFELEMEAATINRPELTELEDQLLEDFHFDNMRRFRSKHSEQTQSRRSRSKH